METAIQSTAMMETALRSVSAKEAINRSESVVDAAQRLIRRTGIQKTTVSEIARELQMSSANIYRFFASRSEINVEVCRRIFDEIERIVEEEIAESPGPASATLREIILAIDRLNTLRFTADRKLHELFEVAHNENWSILREHCRRLDELCEQIIKEGMMAGEFRAGDARLASILFRSICLKFCNPRLTAEEPQPTIEQVVDFCLAALAGQEAAEADRQVLITA